MPNSASDTVCSTYTLEHHTAMNRSKATHMAQKGNQRLGRTWKLALGRWQVLDSGVAYIESVGFGLSELCSSQLK